MKQLIINGNQTQFFFKESIQNSKIAIWVNDNLDKLELNEVHSCIPSLVLFDRILVRGDEDWMTIDIKSIKSLL